MGYEQWAVFKIINLDPFHALVIKDVKALWGKIHENGNKDKDIGVSAVEGKIIPVEKDFTFSTCGRERSPSGAEGWFSIYDNDSGTLVCRCYYDCPYGSSSNTWTMSDYAERWIVQSDGVRLTGALGDITIKATTGA